MRGSLPIISSITLFTLSNIVAADTANKREGTELAFDGRIVEVKSIRAFITPVIALAFLAVAYARKTSKYRGKVGFVGAKAAVIGLKSALQAGRSAKFAGVRCWVVVLIISTKFVNSQTGT